MTNATAGSRVEEFRSLHRAGDPLLLPNPWDAGSARVLQALGFRALATTSSGFAATLGRMDGEVSRDEAVAHAELVASATELPVSADLENGFAHEPAAVAQTLAAAIAAGLAGCSIEDFSGDDASPIYGRRLAAERIAAAADAAGSRIVLTARAENYLHGKPDLADTIGRLQSFQEAGAHVLYAPGITAAEDIRSVVSSVDRPVNVLALADAPSVPELAALGVARVSVGGAFAFAALGALADAGRELLASGTYGFWRGAAAGRAVAGRAFV